MAPRSTPQPARTRGKTKTVEVIDMRDKIPPIDVPVPDLEPGDEEEAPLMGEIVAYTGDELTFKDANGDEQVIPLTEGEVSDMDAARKRMIALALRLSGATYKVIGQQLQCNLQYAQQLVREALNEVGRDEIVLLRHIHHQRLETLLQAVWAGAVNPANPQQLGNVNTAMGILDRIERLFGMNGEVTADENAAVQGGVLVAGGSSTDYRKALQAARKHKEREAI